MAIQLDKVVPWGRSKREYYGMFNLTDECLKQAIVGCGDGPASFNAEMTSCGGHVVSCDPLYALPGNDIYERFAASVDEVLDQVKSTPERWVWKYHRDPDDLKHNRMEVMKNFVADFEQGAREKRYVTGEFPNLPFTDNQFDVALCSHFLFLYSEHFSEAFHVKSVLEMCRIAHDTRIFPILELDQSISRHLNAVCNAVREAGYHFDVIPVDYELQKGGNKMLRITKGDTGL
jgi:hypothetical protein